MMRTNNIKSLQTLVNGYVGTAAPGKQLYFPKHRRIKKFSNVRVMDYTVDYYAPKDVVWRVVLKDMILWYYEHVLSREKKRIDAIFSWVYGKPLPFPERQTSSLSIRLKELFLETGSTFNQMADEIRGYMGPDTKFWRTQGDKEVIVDSSRILSAWKAMKQNQPIEKLAEILYF
jgi:hypothetical protein